MHPLDDVYSGWAGKYSAAMSRITEPPRSFFYFSALTCLGTVMSGRITLASEILPQPRLYCILLGESGDTRKSTAIKMTLNFFQDALSDFPICYGAGSAEGLCEQFRKADRLLLVYDEARTFVNKAKIETSVLLQAVTSLFELNYWQSVTKKHNINITNAHLSLLGASTAETYSTMFNSQFLDIGFINRLFVVKDKSFRKWSIPPKADPTEKDRLKQQLAELLKLITDAAEGGLVEMGLTGDASERWDEWYHDETNERPKGESARRLDTYGMRLMPLLALNDGKTQVDAEIIEKVITILKFEYQTRLEVDPIDADSRIAAMEERIRRVVNSREGINRRDLQRAVHYHRHGIFVFRTAIRNLTQSDEIKFDSKRKEYCPNTF
jgi:hypothetical protein